MISQMQPKPVIGIVGGIGSGKTTAAREFTKHCGFVIDCDVVGHELLGDDTVCRELREHWGESIFADDGSVDRDILGKIVFDSKNQLDALNAILHPRIAARIAELIATAQADPKIIMIAIDAAVLFEAGWDKFCTHTIFVKAPLSQRVKRVTETRGWSKQTLLQRESSQFSLDSKAAKCSHTVDNCSTESHLKEQIFQFVKHIPHE
jgi:dephospho-CoA kinase